MVLLEIVYKKVKKIDLVWKNMNNGLHHMLMMLEIKD